METTKSITAAQAFALHDILRLHDSQNFNDAARAVMGWDYFPHIYGFGDGAREHVHQFIEFLNAWREGLLQYCESIPDSKAVPPKKNKSSY